MAADILFFVSPDGSDENRGEKTSPFRTLAAAQRAARNASKAGKTASVRVMAGTYRENLTFTAEDNGESWSGEGAALTGGAAVKYGETAEPSAEALKRIPAAAAEHVREIDLGALGADPESYRRIYAVGGSTASKYDGYRDGVNLEVFETAGGQTRRISLARYPDSGYLKLDAVLDVGQPGEFPPQNYWYDTWNSLRNPRGGTYIVDAATNEHIKRWAEPEKAWMFGYFFWDWADSSTPVASVDTAHRAVCPAFVSNYGCRAGAQYYFYNVLEELDAEGEYYLDRDTGKLYVYAASPESVFEISLSQNLLITLDGVCGLTVEGFSLSCTRETAVRGNGSRNTLRALKITDVAGHGVVLDGYENTVEHCDISHTARGGIMLSGGDRKTLTPGRNTARYNFIHDYSEVYLTHQPGVTLNGVGNVCAHNEICGAPHDAINYGGNEHLIEYNYIHDVELRSADAGAIYSGMDWAAYGTVIRYNLLMNLGSGEFRPSAIYWDDGLSGQTAYGNVIINAGGRGFLVGGGRDNKVYDNVVAGRCDYPLHYDDRNRDGFVHHGWCHSCCDNLEGREWVNLSAVPYTSEVWAKKYPSLAKTITDFSKYDDPDFPTNPSHSEMENNVIINENGKLGDIAKSVYQYSHIGENPIYHTAQEAGFDMKTLRFDPPRKGFEDFPTSEVGTAGYKA